MAACALRLRPALVSDDYLTWMRGSVQGRRAEYGVAGPDGPPVVFLHGYALGSHAYKRPLRRLARRGCRVWAPAMPSFGATASLPVAQTDLAGYARWVADFMKEVGITAPVVLIGHSLGGGVATKLAHSRPDLVSHVVLLNAVGGVSPRPIRDWATSFLREFSSIPDTVDIALAARDDIVTNILRNPIGLLRAGTMARNADLRTELSELAGLGVPALVLTSEGDSVIPLRCFEAVCDFLGTSGHIVSGNHSWLLTDPESFNQVLGALVDVQVAEHQKRRAITRAGEVAAILSRTRMPAAVIKGLLDSAPALWLMSEPAAVLARDLALCHPRLRPGEIRAVVHPGIDRTEARLTVVAGDRPGLLADSAAVLAANGLSITEASATTWPGPGLALHSFVLRGRTLPDERAWRLISDALRTGPGPAPGRVSFRPVTVDAFGVGEGLFVVKLSAPDKVGVLAAATRWFADHGLSIQAVTAGGRGRWVDDTFLVSRIGDQAEEPLLMAAGGDALAAPAGPPAYAGSAHSCATAIKRDLEGYLQQR
jgi:pimeloyl-ACP methyl ester carboxylesterase/predicted amino acid-binding ACT domain protein